MKPATPNAAAPRVPAKHRMHLCVWFVMFLVAVAMAVGLAAVLVMQEGLVRLDGFHAAVTPTTP